MVLGRTDNKGKTHYFSKSDYKTIFSVFGLEEGSFTLNKIVYCPDTDFDHTNEGGDNELYSVFVIVNDVSYLESILISKKDLEDFYGHTKTVSKINPKIDFGILSYIEDFDKPPFEMILSYNGHNDELYDILPWISI